MKTPVSIVLQSTKHSLLVQGVTINVLGELFYKRILKEKDAMIEKLMQKK